MMCDSSRLPSRIRVLMLVSPFRDFNPVEMNQGSKPIMMWLHTGEDYKHGVYPIDQHIHTCTVNTC